MPHEGNLLNVKHEWFTVHENHNQKIYIFHCFKASVSFLNTSRKIVKPFHIIH